MLKFDEIISKYGPGYSLANIVDYITGESDKLKTGIYDRIKTNLKPEDKLSLLTVTMGDVEFQFSSTELRHIKLTKDGEDSYIPVGSEISLEQGRLINNPSMTMLFLKKSLITCPGRMT